MEKREWTRDDTCLLIENFELYPELWNVHIKEFKDRIKKQNALQKLADLFGTSVVEIQRKLHNLRTQVNQEWRKIQKKKSGQGTDEVYKSTWEFFESLKFIIDANLQNATEDNLTQKPDISETETQNSSTDVERIITEELPRNEPSYSKKKPEKKIKETEDEAILSKAIKVLDRPSDDFQIFGDYVVSELRSLHSEQLQKKLKRMI